MALCAHYFALEFQGLTYLHCSKIGVHGQLTIANCLLDSRWTVRLSDYGLEAVLASFYSCTKGVLVRKPLSLQSTAVFLFFSFLIYLSINPCYNGIFNRLYSLSGKIHLAPEALPYYMKQGNVSQLTPAADIYSFGAILYQILFRKLIVDPDGILILTICSIVSSY